MNLTLHQTLSQPLIMYQPSIHVKILKFLLGYQLRCLTTHPPALLIIVLGDQILYPIIYNDGHMNKRGYGVIIQDPLP